MDRIVSILKHEKFNSYAILVLYVLVIAGSIFLYKDNQKHWLALEEENRLTSEYIELLKSNFASTTDILSENITSTKNSLSSQIEKEKSNLTNQIGGVKSEVGSLSGTLTNLEKLSKTDAELLQKYSKVYFLNEHYQPVELSEIPKEYSYYENRTLQFHSNAFNNLIQMINDAKNDEVELYVYSAFRSFNTQAALKGQYTVTYGAGTANQFSADQGYSEHQLGTTVDLITTGIGGTLDGFDGTKAYEWLLSNAYKYGFVLSYPKDNSYYIFEPWHWRFVGKSLALYLHNEKKSFYDLDQRKIDEYLINLFD